MNYRDPELQDRLAASYVLGGMKGAAMRRFAHLMRDDARLRQTVNEWEDRMLPLALSLEPIAPPAQVWQHIAQDIRQARPQAPPKAGWWQGLRFWQFLAGGLAVAVIGLSVSLSYYLPASHQPVRTLALLTSSDGTSSYVMNRVGQGAISVQSVAAITPEASKALELWAITPGAAPRSLGLVQAKGTTVLQLATPPAPGDTVAITIEPAGGSPSGAPTGPVVLSGTFS